MRRPGAATARTVTAPSRPGAHASVMTWYAPPFTGNEHLVLERALRALPGIQDCAINPLNGAIRIHCAPDEGGLDEAARCIAGFTAPPRETPHDHAPAPPWPLHAVLWGSLALLIALHTAGAPPQWLAALAAACLVPALLPYWPRARYWKSAMHADDSALTAAGALLLAAAALLANRFEISPHHGPIAALAAIAIHHLLRGLQARRQCQFLAKQRAFAPGYPLDAVLASPPRRQALTDEFNRYAPNTALVLLLGLAAAGGLAAVAGHPALGARLWLGAAAAMFCVASGPMLLALHAAQAAGLAESARRGYRFHALSALNDLQETRVLALRRRGILVDDAPKVTEIRACPPETRESLAGLAAGLAQKAPHSFAEAIRAYAKQHWIAQEPVEDAILLPGQGVAGRAAGLPVFLGVITPGAAPGSRREPGPLADWMGERHTEGKSVLLLFRDDQLAGGLAIRDPLKADSVQTVKLLHQIPVRTVLLSAASSETVRANAEQLGIPAAHGHVSGESLSRILDELRAETIGPVAYCRRSERADCAEILFPPEEEAGAELDLPPGNSLRILEMLLIARTALSRAQAGVLIAWSLPALGIALALAGALPPPAAAAVPPLAAIAALAFADALHAFSLDRCIAALRRRRPQPLR